MMCNKCSGLMGGLLLLAGLAFLLVDIGVWAFWGVSWFTVVFLLLGFAKVAKGKCPDCCSVESGKKKK
ncbi:hypothetical protein HOA92_05250 [archaeon]|jgi:hypothetical protein|nr:hypothetical protein [archaeon]MBT6762421.1 hypothetical protein [archaeon]